MVAGLCSLAHDFGQFSRVAELNGSCLKSFSNGSALTFDSASQAGSSGVCREIEMKRFVAATALTLALISGVVTTAQADNRNSDRHERHYDRRDDRHDRDWDRHDNRNDRRDWDRHDNRYDRRDWDRSHSFRYYDGRRFDRGRYLQPHGYYYRSWRYGDYLPRAYYGRRYIVNDYYAYHLYRPPYGYHWVRVDNDIVLASIASGLVVSAVFEIFH
jgi:Ni/Co efflux regulator RcnB